MNKILILFITLLTVTGVLGYLLFWPSSPSQRTPSPSAKNAILKPLPVDIIDAQGVFIKNGKVFEFENQKFTEMLKESSVTLSNGAVVKDTGEIIEKDGTKINLIEDQAYYFSRQSPNNN